VIPPRQLILDIRPEAPPRFDNFIAGSNLEAASACYLAADSAGGEAVIYLWGAAGSGRSHLLQAAITHACEMGRTVCLAHADLPEELPELLAVDGVDALNDADQVRLFSLINRAREEGASVLAAGDVAPVQLSLRPELATRLGAGLVFQVSPLNEVQCAEAVRERAQARGLVLSDEMLRYLLVHARRDLKSLLAVVDRLDELSLSRKRPASPGLLREVLAGD
jgi:DnaA family protein